MMISARNQIDVSIEEIKHGVVSTILVLTTSQGTKMYASITESSTETMHLQVGDKVMAFFKASHVLVATGWAIPISARNKLQGKIKKISMGAVNAEITIEMPNEDVLKSIITNEAVQDMALKIGEDVVAIIKSSDVMIAKE